METIKCNDIIEEVLRQGNQDVAKQFSSDVLFLKAPMRPPIDDAIKDEIEELTNLKGSNKKLTVFVETNGGYIETVERIVSVFRKHFDIVNYVVPNYAYSAGTILVLSGDDIFMDYYSVLGPIDPQMEDEDGKLVPGLGYLAKYQELLDTINQAGIDPATIRGELSFLLSKFEPAKLFWIEQSIEHSKQLLREWLPKYKFKNWTFRETSKAAVTDNDRQQRADEIAKVLGDAKRWHSHGRGVTISDLASDDIKLKIQNYSDNKSLYGNISHYYGLMIDYMNKRGFRSALHSKRGIRRLA